MLDVGGVLLANLGAFWRELADLAGAPYGELRDRYRREMRGPFWSGRIPEPDFWSWLAADWPGLDVTAARRALSNGMKPLPALECLQQPGRPAYPQQPRGVDPSGAASHAALVRRR